MEQFLVSARKYRPNAFSFLVGQENIAVTLKNSILNEQLAHAYLFCGPRGVGKTTTARIFAKLINCLSPTEDMEPCGQCESCVSFDNGASYCIHELDAASNNSVDDIRSLIDIVRVPPQIGKYSVYIIDEVHMLSAAAFNAFLKTLEEPPAHAKFILATTEKHKIIPTILSRCQTYDFNRISIPDIVFHLEDIAKNEGVVIDEDAKHIIAQKADGAMRDALTLFDQAVAFCGKNISYELIVKNLNILEYSYYFNLVEKLLSGDYIESILIFDQLLSKGFNALHFISGLSTHFRDLLVCKNGAADSLLSLPPSIMEKYREQANKTTPSFLFQNLKISTDCEASYRQSGNPKLLIELALIKMSQANNTNTLNSSPAVSSQNSTSDSTSTTQEKIVEKTLSTTSTEEVPSEVELKQKNEEKTIPIAPKVIPSTGLSLKKLMQEAEDKIANQKTTEKISIKDEPFSSEIFLEVWEGYINNEEESGRKSLAAALRLYNPSIKEDSTEVTIFVSNSSQKSWVEDKKLYEMNSFVREKMMNKEIKITVELTPDTEIKEKKLYMPTEKAQHLLKNNAELRELKKDLDLDLK